MTDYYILNTIIHNLWNFVVLSSWVYQNSSDWEGKYDIENKRMTGFLAQEVAEAAREANYDFSGVDIPENKM